MPISHRGNHSVILGVTVSYSLDKPLVIHLGNDLNKTTGMKPKASESEVFDFLTFVSVNDIDKNNRVFTIKILTLWHSLFMLEKSI